MNELLMEKIALLPEEIKNLLKVVVSDEHFVTLVGGAVRDILLGRGIPSNLDFEMRLRTKGADPKAALSLIHI